MSRRPIHLLIRDMLERIDRIGRYTAGMDRHAFFGDEKTADSVIRNLEVIGEAANRLPEDFRDRYLDPVAPNHRASQSDPARLFRC